MGTANLPEPVFQNGDEFIVSFYNGEYPERYPEVLKSKIDEFQDEFQDGFQDKIYVEFKDCEAKFELTWKILAFCRSARSVQEITKEFNLNRRNLNKTYIVPLINAGYLKMTIPNKPTSKYQKYISVQNDEDI